jgi:hypothetical protein
MVETRRLTNEEREEATGLANKKVLVEAVGILGNNLVDLAEKELLTRLVRAFTVARLERYCYEESRIVASALWASLCGINPVEMPAYSANGDVLVQFANVCRALDSLSHAQAILEEDLDCFADGTAIALEIIKGRHEESGED